MWIVSTLIIRAGNFTVSQPLYRQRLCLSVVQWGRRGNKTVYMVGGARICTRLLRVGFGRLMNYLVDYKKATWAAVRTIPLIRVQIDTVSI